MKSYLGLICAVTLLCLPTVSLAAQQAVVDVSADVAEQLELVLWIKQVEDTQDPGVEGTEVEAMHFGALTDTFADGSPAGNLFSRRWFSVFMIAKSSGRPYDLKQGSGGLTSGSNRIPDNTFMMIPDYIKEDEFEWPSGSAAQGQQPPGSTLGSPGSAFGAKTIYTSDPLGLSRIIRCYYVITNGYKDKDVRWPGFTGEAISLDQPAGHYAGSVTFAVVLR